MIDAIVDISHFNRDPDFVQAKAAGVLAVINKATQGVGYTDSSFGANRIAALAAGLSFGSYHFLTGSTDGATQAQFYLKTVGPEIGQILALDFEANPSGSSATLTIAAACASAIHAAVGVWPLLYAGGFLKDALRGGTKAPAPLLNCPLWLAQYAPQPVMPAGWTTWALWQWTDSHLIPAPPVPGIGLCDRDKFNGTVDELIALWGAHSPGIPTP